MSQRRKQAIVDGKLRDCDCSWMSNSNRSEVSVCLLYVCVFICVSLVSDSMYQANMATSGDQYYTMSIVISQLPDGCDEHTIYEFCRQHMSMKSMLHSDVLIAKSNKAYVIFEDEDHVPDAIANLNLKEVRGTKVRVRAATMDHAMELAGLRKLKEGDKTTPLDVSGLLQQLLAHTGTMTQDDKAKIAASLPTLLSAIGGGGGPVTKEPEDKKEDVVKQNPNPSGSHGSGHSHMYSDVVNPQFAAYAPSSLRISTFSGHPQCKGGEVTYRQWRFEVMGLVNDGNRETHILQTIRKSLRGAASEVLLSVGESATLSQLLREMETVFGNVASTEKLLQDFYRASQTSEQSVSTWASSISNQMTVILARDDSTIDPSNRNLMLRRKFFAGLESSDLKNALRHKYDGGETYNNLVLSARELELENAERKVRVQEASATTIDTPMARKLDEILSKVSSLEKRLEASEKRSGGTNTQTNSTNKTNSNTSQDRGSAKDGRSGGRRFPGKCFACGETGHRKWECPLNSQQPASGGGR